MHRISHDLRTKGKCLNYNFYSYAFPSKKRYSILNLTLRNRIYFQNGLRSILIFNCKISRKMFIFQYVVTWD